MKKWKNRIGLILLSLFSFYYTHQATEWLKEKDPLMTSIKEMEEKYQIASLNAQVIGDNILSGKKGKEVDREETYQKMKKYGTYNESLTILKDTKPVVSIEDIYDKYVVGGNKTKKEIALVFPVKENSPDKVIQILKQNKIEGTIFIDGTYLEKNILKIKNNKNIEWEILSYQNSYDKSFFETSLSYLESITKKTPNYCYTETKQEEVLNLCKSIHLHMIKPTIIIEKDLLKNIKDNIGNGLILSISINSMNEKELSTTIQYIKEKGYQLVTLKDLLEE